MDKLIIHRIKDWHFLKWTSDMKILIKNTGTISTQPIVYLKSRETNFNNNSQVAIKEVHVKLKSWKYVDSSSEGVKTFYTILYYIISIYKIQINVSLNNTQNNYLQKLL